MRRRFVFAILTCLVGGAAAGAGCGSDGHNHPVVDGGPHDADFSVCEGTPAVMYMPGISVTSAMSAYVVTLVEATTAGTPPVKTPEIGYGIWVVSVTDATTGAPADVVMTAERPIMPRHGHGATTYPVVSPGDAGMFTVSEINFFMAGYWQFQLNLMPAGGAADTATFSICIPQ
jgi:hypothetical protein